MSSLTMQINAAMGALPVAAIVINRDIIRHGVKAVEVKVTLKDGRYVVGTFDREQKAKFGSTKEVQHYDIPGLMRAKVESVLAGTAEATG